MIKEIEEAVIYMLTPVVIFLFFLLLKLTGTIDWTWIWITSPLWIGAGLALINWGGKR